MKTLTCKMCGSTQLIEENGMYLCQSCGTKYSASELDDSNKTDETPSPEMLKKEAEKQEEIKRLRVLAKNDMELYGRILNLDYGDWEAYFYYHIVYNKYENGKDEYLIKSYLPDVLYRLRDNISSNIERQKAIKSVIYSFYLDLFEYRLGIKELPIDLKHIEFECRYGYSYAILNGKEYRPYELENKLKDISLHSYYDKLIDKIENRIIGVFGEEFRDFTEEFRIDYDNLKKEHLKRFEVLKELIKVLEEKEKQESEKQRKEQRKKERERKIGEIIGFLFTFIGIFGILGSFPICFKLGPHFIFITIISVLITVIGIIGLRKADIL